MGGARTPRPEELLAAIRQAAGGARYVTDTLATVESQRLTAPSTRMPHHDLTTREYTVFLALIAGKTVKKTADELKLSASTVSNHVAAIRDKLGAATISDILRYAHRAGLL
ncbi:MAG: DNA-binding NarL/FixJ family response regulator [Myxococcota bacterium]